MSTPDNKPLLSIRPPSGFGRLNIRALWRYRDLLYQFTARDLTLRYRQTALGVIWVVLQPLLAAGVFSLVFGRVAGFSGDGQPYFLFAFAGLTAWTLYYNVLTRSSGAMLANTALISKVFFPRVVLPFSALGSSLVDFATGLVVLLALIASVGHGFDWRVITLPLWIATLALQAIGLGLVLSALVVRYRDVQYIVPIAVQLLLFASPVAYSLDRVPHNVRWAFLVNPLTGALEATRWSTLGTGAFPNTAIYSVACGVSFALLGLAWFAHMERGFADVI